MSKFRLVEIDLQAAPAPLQLATDELGLALIVRHHGRPVGFTLHDCEPGSRVGVEELARLAATAGAQGVVLDAVRDDLALQRTPTPCPTVTIAVCTHNRPLLLERCLASILAARAATAREALITEVLVVDNAPGDAATRAVVERAPGVRYLCEPIPGLDFARNAAWRGARGDYVAFVDDDATLDRSWAGGCMRALQAHPDAGAVTGLVLPLALETEAQVLFEKGGGFRRGFVPRRWQGASRSDDRLYPLGAGRFGAGCNMVIRRELLATLGGFDEALDTGAPLPGGGDLDIFYRVLRAGEPLVYEPSMAVHHEHRRTLDGLQRQYHSWGLGFLAFLGKVWRTEPPVRRQVVTMVRWWTTWMLGRLGGACLRSSPPLPVPMVAAELAGGVEGALGEYQRSLARVRLLRRFRR